MLEIVKQNYKENKEIYNKIYNCLISNLGENTIINHVGSTAIPNMYGKNIIDILVGVKDINQMKEFEIKLINIGYYSSTHNNEDDNYKFFSSTNEETKSGYIHIHLALLNTKRYNDFLILRDYLLSNKDEVKRYSNLKKQILKKGIYDRKEYKSIKGNYVNELLKRANDWKQNNNIKLIPLKNCINKDVYNMYQDIPKIELGSSNILKDISYDEFLEKTQEMIKEETIINPNINTTTKRYILFKNNYPIGEIGIRTTLNDFWINKGSQIFYKIRLKERGKGYGNEILSLGLKEAKLLGFKKVRINCDNINLPSKKIILNNGGIPDIVDYKNSEGGISTSYIINLE